MIPEKLKVGEPVREKDGKKDEIHGSRIHLRVL